MPNFSRSQIGCRASLHVSISAMCKCGYPSNVSCNKFCDIAKIRSMAINGIPLGYVNNYDKNRYLEKDSKAAVYLFFNLSGLIPSFGQEELIIQVLIILWLF